MSSQNTISLSTSSEIAPERVWRWARDFDPVSFEHFILALAHKSGEVYGWTPPEHRDDETTEEYAKRVEASFMQLTGQTLAALILSARGYTALWAKHVLERGLTLLPDFLVDDTSRSLDTPLREWFEECHVADAIGRSAMYRVIGYLTKVVPLLRRYGEVDECAIALLVDDQRGIGFPAKARIALDTVQAALYRKGKVPEDIGKVIANHLSTGDRDPDAMERELSDLGYRSSRREHPHAAGQPNERRKVVIPFGVYMCIRSDGSEGTDFLIRTNSKEDADFTEDYLAKGPFVASFDLGQNADQARRSYLETLSSANPQA